jgi:hypothetical protein
MIMDEGELRCKFFNMAECDLPQAKRHVACGNYLISPYWVAVMCLRHDRFKKCPHRKIKWSKYDNREL